MTNVKINNEINLNYPDGFKEMGEEELTRYFGTPKDRWGVYNADNHSILSVSWTKAGFMSDAETELYEMTARLRRRLLNYQQITSYDLKIAKTKAYGVRFEYRVNDSARVHIVDLVVFKNKGKYYAVYFITRKHNAASARPAFKEVLDSIALG